MATGDLAQNVVDKQQTETGNSADKSTMRNLTDPIEDWVDTSTNQAGNADTVDNYHAGNDSGQVPVSNGTVNTNLNADLLDGNDATDFASSGHTHPGGDITSQVGDADTVDGNHAGNSTGNVPLNNGTVNTDLNADQLDGNDASAFASTGHTHPGSDVTSQVGDADTVDGEHASAFADSSHTHPGSDITSQVGDADSVDGADLSTDTSLGTSDTLVPSQNAVKTYVDNNAGGGGADYVNYEITYNSTDDSLDFNYIG